MRCFGSVAQLWNSFCAMSKSVRSTQFGLLLDALALFVFYRVEYSISERLFIPKSSILSNPCHFAHVCASMCLKISVTTYIGRTPLSSSSLPTRSPSPSPVVGAIIIIRLLLRWLLFHLADNVQLRSMTEQRNVYYTKLTWRTLHEPVVFHSNSFPLLFLLIRQ